MLVKICGLKRPEDVKLVCSARADFAGFIVGAIYKTEDEVKIEEYLELVKHLSSNVIPVVVTHFEDRENLIYLVETARVRVLQIQGNVSPGEIYFLKCRFPYLRVVKAVHVTGRESIEVAEEYSKVADAILLDTRTEDRIGGTGLTHDWSISAEIVRRVSRPVFLAGGLNPENVVEAIKVVKPVGVDVNSGTKSPDGFKDPEKVRLFVRRAKEVFKRLTDYGSK